MDRTNAPGHVNHLFVAEDPATNRPPTELVAQDLNAHQEELINVILAAQLVPSAANNAQVLEALNAMFAKINGATGLIRTLTPAGGARIRELGDIANAATVGGIEFGISYNCNIDPATGVWAGRDVADICWLEKWTDVGGVKEFWYAPTAAAGVVPAWVKVLSFDVVNGVISIANSPLMSGSIAQDFRLSLTAGVPVTTADVAAAATLYAVPYRGNRIGLWDGAKWVNYLTAQFSIALNALTAAKPYDVFCYQNVGVPTLELLAWTNDTARATALAYQDGVLVKSGDATRRYLGTFYTTSANTTEDSAANRYLWNYYNRAVRSLKRLETTAQWTYTLQTWRQANASIANQVNFIVGVSEDEISATISSMTSNTTANTGTWLGMALDSLTIPDRQSYLTNITSGLGMSFAPVSNSYFPTAGRHFIAWLEQSAAAGTTVWYAGGVYCNSGIIGRMMA